jgi:cell division transport system permease protein
VDVKNDSTLMVDVYNNLSRILKWILGFSLLFLVLAVVLINNSIRLKIFSKRFIIKTMQLVGAKRRFILKPFIIEAIILGAIGSTIGLLALGGVWYYFTSQIGSAFVQDNNQYFWLVILVLGVGIFISVLSTIFATWRFLKSNVDDLYYS